MKTLIAVTALTQSHNHWKPLKGLYLRNVLLVSQKEDSGYVACQELQTGAKTEAPRLGALVSLLNTQRKKYKKRYSGGIALLFSGWGVR